MQHCGAKVDGQSDWDGPYVRVRYRALYSAKKYKKNGIQQNQNISKTVDTVEAMW